jgi:hypothetical protein
MLDTSSGSLLSCPSTTRAKARFLRPNPTHHIQTDRPLASLRLLSGATHQILEKKKNLDGASIHCASVHISCHCLPVTPTQRVWLAEPRRGRRPAERARGFLGCTVRLFWMDTWEESEPCMHGPAVHPVCMRFFPKFYLSPTPGPMSHVPGPPRGPPPPAI